jgi:hypothetical protein
VVGAANIGSVFVRVRIDGSYSPVIRFDRKFLFVMGPFFGFKCDLRELGRFRHSECFTNKAKTLGDYFGCRLSVFLGELFQLWEMLYLLVAAL